MRAHSGMDDPLWLRASFRRIFHFAGHKTIRLGIRRLRLRRRIRCSLPRISIFLRSKLGNGRVLWRRTRCLRNLLVLYRKAPKRNVNPKPFLQIDRVIHEKGRLPIMSLLAASGELSFTDIREALDMTDGNLSVHIKTLQEAGFVA